jgi:pyridoxamine 5'-phosphate oxidase
MSHVEHKVPFERFAQVFDEAKKHIAKDANAMQLATVDARGRPTIRTVLLKDFDERGFVFYTNHTSRKALELKTLGFAALNFYLKELDAQVRIEGAVEVGTPQEADAYFATRPRVSQLGAWASLQSQPLESRSVLESRLAAVTQKFDGQPVKRPGHWMGFRLIPDYFEFWKAHEFRLHYREAYTIEAGGWAMGLLYP